MVSAGLLVFCGCTPSFIGSGAPSLDVTGSEPAPTTSLQVAYQEPSLPKSSQVFAQGRLLPSRGIVRISALPGDRLEKIAVEPGQPISQGDTIAKLQSFGLRSLELESALLKLSEAKALLEVKQKEAALLLDAAKLKQQSASLQLKQALAQRQQATQGIAQVESLGKQIETLERLRNDPLTRAAIGTIELETRRNEMQRASSISEQTVLASNHAVELGQLQVEQAERSVISALESSMLVDKGSPVASLEKQIEILKEQVRQSQLLSPLDGFVISVNAEAGERVGQLPIAEVADLSEMACMAEVHESDVGKIAVGNRVELRSPAIQRTLSGTVTRIDRVVGSVQMRSPNPMARSDFRAVPVWITIDPNDVEIASRRLQLQVDVAISSVQ